MLGSFMSRSARRRRHEDDDFPGDSSSDDDNSTVKRAKGNTGAPIATAASGMDTHLLTDANGYAAITFSQSRLDPRLTLTHSHQLCEWIARPNSIKELCNVRLLRILSWSAAEYDHWSERNG
jgi:hypothetical protein